MEWARFPIPAVVTLPAYRRAAPVLQAAYFNAAMDLWMEGTRVGQPVMRVDEVGMGSDLVTGGLALDQDGMLSIEWVTEAWAEMLRLSERQRKNAQVRWAAHAMAMPRHSGGIAMGMPPLSVSSSSSPKRARARIAPDDFALTEERLAYAQAQGLAATDARREFESFKLYEFRDPKSDWHRCWQRWCRKASATSPKTAPTGYGSDRTNTDCHRCGAVYWVDEGHDCPKEAAR